MEPIYELMPTAEDEREIRRKRELFVDRMAGSFVFALVADGRYYDNALRRRVTADLGLDMLDLGTASGKMSESGRVEPASTALGYVPSAGAFPETLLEHRLRTELLQPMAVKLEEVDSLGLAVGNELYQYVEDLIEPTA